MTRSMKKRTRIFTARGEDGREVKIHEIRQFTEVSTVSGSPDEIPGPKEFFTEDREDVNWVGEGRYRIVATGEMLTSNEGSD